MSWSSIRSAGHHATLIVFTIVFLLCMSFQTLARLTESKEQRLIRIFKARYYNSYWEPVDHCFFFDATLGWRCRPRIAFDFGRNGWTGTFHIDESGFRYLPHLDHRSEGALNYYGAPLAAARHRLLIVGDSVAFSQGAHDDETIEHFLVSFSKTTSIKILGVPGWSPEQYFLALSNYVKLYKPTSVYVVMTHLNDLDALKNCAVFNRIKPTVVLSKGRPTRIALPSELNVFSPSDDSLF
jgi:hypothetical protein